MNNAASARARSSSRRVIGDVYIYIYKDTRVLRVLQKYWIGYSKSIHDIHVVAKWSCPTIPLNLSNQIVCVCVFICISIKNADDKVERP